MNTAAAINSRFSDKPRILIVEDEDEVRDAIQSVLAIDYDTLTARDGLSAIRLAKREKPDLVLLDLMLPGIDGVEVCRKLKSASETRLIPILMITATNDDDRRAEALLAGADQLTSKPFNPREFTIRINTLISNSDARAKRGNEPPIECGNLRVDPKRLEVTIDGDAVEMTVLEIKLLVLFIRNLGVILTRKQILEAVWNERDVLDRVVDNHVLSLRKKLTSFDHDLVSVYGAGYGIKTTKK